MQRPQPSFTFRDIPKSQAALVLVSGANARGGEQPGENAEATAHLKGLSQ